MMLSPMTVCTRRRDVPPEGEGWERDFSRGRDGDNWDRFDYHEEAYWKRRVTPVPEEETNHG